MLADGVYQKRMVGAAGLSHTASRVFWIHMGILLGGLAFWGMGAACQALWYDESFTVATVSQSWEGLMRTAAADFHPPLYYCMLKIFCSLFGYTLPVMRAFSLLPMLGMCALGYTQVRRLFGERAGILFSLLVALCPAVPFFANEIRMYAWALLFTTLAACYAWRWHTHGQAAHACFMVLFAVLGAYTHYYALLAVLAINLLLLASGIRRRVKAPALLLPAAAQLLGYLPGCVWLLHKAKNVAAGYWIPNTPLLYLAALLMIGISAALAVLVRRDARFAAASRAAAWVVALTLGIALAFSLCIRPVFMPRYLIPLSGLLLFQCTALLHGKEKKFLRNTLVVWAALCLACQAGSLVRSYAPRNTELTDLCAQLGPQDAIVVGHCQFAGPLAVEPHALPVYWIGNKDPLNPLAFDGRAIFSDSVDAVPIWDNTKILVIDTQTIFGGPPTNLRADMLARGFEEAAPSREIRPPYQFWSSMRISTFTKPA